MTRLLLSLIAVILSLSCANPQEEQQVTAPPDGPPYIEGTLERVEPSSLLVHSGDGSNQAMLRLTPETLLLSEFGGGYEPADIAELRKGQHVAAWVSGPVAESFPVQADADAVVITAD